VELALLLPLLLVLLLGTIDFGRAFFGWVAVTNAARVGANYAATHPDAWALNNIPQQNEYKQLIRDSGADNCNMYGSSDPPPPQFPDRSRDLGDRVRVDLECQFELVNPFVQPLVGPFTLSATATFNVRRGCVDCEQLVAGPPPPAENHCRQIPNIVGLSVAGAKLKWQAAGFTGDFGPPGIDDSRTVATRTVDQGGAEGCSGTWAFFASSVSVTLTAIQEPAPGDTCRTVPNLLGMTVADARTTWQAA
jgi:hypothetical protein